MSKPLKGSYIGDYFGFLVENIRPLGPLTVDCGDCVDAQVENSVEVVLLKSSQCNKHGKTCSDNTLAQEKGDPTVTALLKYKLAGLKVYSYLC